MNSSEGIDMAKMAVMIFVVVLVIGTVVGLAYMAYGWVTSGSDKLSDTVNSLDSSSYAQYDDAQCSGTDVLTALKSYRDSDIAILICNKENDSPGMNKQSITTCYNYCGLVKEATEHKETVEGKDITYGYKVSVNYGKEGTDGMDGAYWVSEMNWVDGLTKRNTNFSPTTDKSLKPTYVRSNAKFYSNLVYDYSTGEVCGILFCQMQ